MDAPERTRRALAALSVLILAACSGAPEPTALPPQTVTPGPAEGTETAPPPPPQPEPAQQPATRSDPTGLVTIEAPAAEPEPEPSLVEVARRERARREQATEPIAVITDANLKEHAIGQLTFMEGEEPAPADEGAAAGEPTAAPAGEAAGGEAGEEKEKGEAYWRRRVRELRARWRAAADRIPRLEEQVADLREQFYAADDPYYRDSRIKPAWDRAIDQIAQTRAEAEAHRQELQRVLEEGRQAGALPGWLREGIELEPAAEEPAGEEHEPGEPQILDIDEPGGAR